VSEPGDPQAGLEVLYADADLIAVDKPAGLHTAPLGREGEDTLLGRMIERYPEVARLPGIKPVEPGLLHRLDRDTSGIVLIARTPEAFQLLMAEFAGGRVRKEYLALCVPQAGFAPAAVQAGQRFAVESRFAPFGPGRRKVQVVLPAGNAGAGADADAYSVGRCPVGRGPARLHRAGRKASPGIYRTEAEVLELRGSRALVRAVILRGFRHQVRAHLAFLGLPIVGDALYGVAAPPGARDRLYLHATAVELALPSSGRKLRIDAPLPPDFALCYGSNGRTG
jgi:23S rRNA pseudouridine1911/1915/1917 synthase